MFRVQLLIELLQIFPSRGTEHQLGGQLGGLGDLAVAPKWSSPQGFDCPVAGGKQGLTHLTLRL